MQDGDTPTDSQLGSVIAFLEHLQQIYMLPSKKDQRLRLSLASFGCGLKLKIFFVKVDAH